MRPATAVLATLILLGRAGAAAAQDPPSLARSSLEGALGELRRDIPGVALPSAGSVTQGRRTIPAGEVVRGPIATWGGDLEILGQVTGDAVAIGGDVIVAP